VQGLDVHIDYLVIDNKLSVRRVTRQALTYITPNLELSKSQSSLLDKIPNLHIDEKSYYGQCS
jgi:hypothetical protein